MAKVESITGNGPLVAPVQNMVKAARKAAKQAINVESITGERLLKVEEVAALIGAAVGTLNRARVFGGNFPAYVKRGKSVRYKLSTVEKWMADQEEFTTTSQIDARETA